MLLSDSVAQNLPKNFNSGIRHRIIMTYEQKVSDET